MAEVAEASPAARTAGRPPADRSGLRLGLFVGGLLVALLAGFGLGRLNNGGGSLKDRRPLGSATIDLTKRVGMIQSSQPF